MSNIVQGYVWNIEFPNPLAKMIALKLADNANDEGGDIYPATTTVAYKVGCARSVVCKWQFALEHCGVLKVVNRSEGGTREDTTERAYDMDLLRRLARLSRNSDPELMLVEAVIERPVTSKNGTPKLDKDGNAKVARITVFELQPYQPPVRETDGSPVRQEDGSESDPSAKRTAAVRQEDGSRPPGGHEPFKGIPSGNPFDSPPAPQGGPREGGKYADLIDQLRAEGIAPHVVERLIVPLLRGLTIAHHDPAGLLRDIRDHRRIAELPDHALDLLAQHLKDEREKLTAPKNVIAAIPQVTRGLSWLRVAPTDASWAAWCDHLRREGQGGRIPYYERQGFVPVLTLWPHWHPSYRQPEPPAPAAAPEVSQADAERMGRVRDRLRQTLGEEVFRCWLEALALVAVGDGRVSLSLPIKFNRTYVASHHAAAIEAACAAEFGDGVRVEIVAPPATAPKPNGIASNTGAGANE